MLLHEPSILVCIMIFDSCKEGLDAYHYRGNHVFLAGTQPNENLTERLTKGSFLKDIKHISGQQATYSLDAFYSVYNHFTAKMLAFSYHGMTSRYEDINI